MCIRDSATDILPLQRLKVDVNLSWPRTLDPTLCQGYVRLTLITRTCTCNMKRVQKQWEVRGGDRFQKLYCNVIEICIFYWTTSEWIISWKREDETDKAYPNTWVPDFLVSFLYLRHLNRLSWTILSVVWATAVSYTHLDVYKRQPLFLVSSNWTRTV